LLLTLFAYIGTKTNLGPAIRKAILKENRFIRLRNLAAQINLPPLHYPIRRLSHDQRTKVEKNDCQENDELCISNAIESFQRRKTEKVSPSLPGVLDYHEAYVSGKTTPIKAMERVILAVEIWQRSNYNIFSSFSAEEVRQQAKCSAIRYGNGKPLSVFDGVPIALKDMVKIANRTYYNGKRPTLTATNADEEEDAVVKNFRRLGAIILGLTIMTEGGVTPLGYNSHFQGPVRVLGAPRYTGGSSGGSAVAVASGLTPTAIGCDNGGYIHIPRYEVQPISHSGGVT
jgi:hypothetical protein